jgi:hypothetical protein
MLTQLKAKELILLIQDGFHVLSVVSPNPDLINSLKSELSDLRDLASGQGLSDVIILVQKLDKLLEILPKEVSFNAPVLSAENLQFIFEALRLISAYLESGNPPRGLTANDMVCALDMLYEKKVADINNTSQTQEIKPTEENPKPALIEQVDTMKDTLFQNPNLGMTEEAIPDNQEESSQPAEPQPESNLTPTEETPKSSQINSEPLVQNQNQAPKIKSEWPLVQEIAEPAFGTEPENQETCQPKEESLLVPETENKEPSPSPENTEQVMIPENIETESLSVEENQVPLPLEQIVVIPNTNPPASTKESETINETQLIPEEVSEENIEDQTETQIELPLEPTQAEEELEPSQLETTASIESEEKLEPDSLVEPEHQIETNEEPVEVTAEEDNLSTQPEVEISNEPEETALTEIPIECEKAIETQEESTEEVLNNPDSHQIPTEETLTKEPENEPQPQYSIEIIEPLASQPPITEEPIKEENLIPGNEVPSRSSEIIAPRLPVDFGIPCLIIKVNDQAFALPHQVVEKVEKFRLSDLKLVRNDIVANYNNNELKMIDLTSALGYQSKEEGSDKETFLAAICQVNGNKVGVLFDDTLGFEPLKWEEFHSIIGKIKGIAGISVYKSEKQTIGEEPYQPVIIVELSDLL